MLSGATKYQITDVVAHGTWLEHTLFQFFIKDSIMGVEDTGRRLQRKAKGGVSRGMDAN